MSRPVRHLYLVIAAAALAMLATAAGIALTEPPAQAPPAAVAEIGHLVYRSGSYTIELTEAPCQFREFAEQLEEEGVPPAKLSVLILASRRFTGCYVFDIGGDVMLLDPTSTDVGNMPIGWFTRDPGV